ncbi:MAG: hypothetical protein SFY70_04960 [Bacteroidia bacterium]|nr:hypothetical protein [Bacteroidia bacterium]
MSSVRFLPILLFIMLGYPAFTQEVPQQSTRRIVELEDFARADSIVIFYDKVDVDIYDGGHRNYDEILINWNDKFYFTNKKLLKNIKPSRIALKDSILLDTLARFMNDVRITGEKNYEYLNHFNAVIVVHLYSEGFIEPYIIGKDNKIYYRGACHVSERYTHNPLAYSKNPELAFYVYFNKKLNELPVDN